MRNEAAFSSAARTKLRPDLKAQRKEQPQVRLAASFRRSLHPHPQTKPPQEDSGWPTSCCWKTSVYLPRPSLLKSSGRSEPLKQLFRLQPLLPVSEEMQST